MALAWLLDNKEEYALKGYLNVIKIMYCEIVKLYTRVW